MNAKDIELMQMLRDDGMTIREIAEKFEVSFSIVQDNTSKPENLMSATSFGSQIKDANFSPSSPIRVMRKNKIIGTFFPA
jgi:hypothetical protein